MLDNFIFFQSMHVLGKLPNTLQTQVAILIYLFMYGTREPKSLILLGMCLHGKHTNWLQYSVPVAAWILTSQEPWGLSLTVCSLGKRGPERLCYFLKVTEPGSRAARISKDWNPRLLTCELRAL